MARSIWSGTIEFGLVSIPISLSTATESKSIAFHQLHKKCGARIREQRYCPHCDEVVDYDDIEKGFEYQKNKYVVVTQDELESLPLPSKKVIILSSFVDQSQIDPLYFNGAYYAEPDRAAERPFTLLMTALEKKNMVAVGTLALRNKERLCCIRAHEDALVVELLLYPDEIRKAPAVDLDKRVSEKELAVADHLIELMAGDFEPDKYKDHYRKALTAMIDKKLEGEEIVTSAEPERKGRVVDLMEALQASVESAKKGSNLKGTGKRQTASKEDDREEGLRTSTTKSARKENEHVAKPKPKASKTSKASKGRATSRSRTTGRQSAKRGAA